MKDSLEGASFENRLWGWVLKALVPLSFSFFAWSVTQHFAADKRITVIESNRYTPNDALNFERSMNRRFEELNGTMNELLVQVRLLRQDATEDRKAKE